jgi:hypothetical protein
MKKTYYRTDRALERHTDVIMMTIYNLLYTNDIVSGYLHDAVCAFKKTNHYRHEAKRLLNAVEKERIKYEHDIFRTVGDKAEYFADTAEKFIEASGIESAISILYVAIKQTLDDAGIEDSDIFAKMETARTLLDVCTEQHKWRINDLRKLDSDLSHIRCNHLSMDGATKTMNRLMDSFSFGKDIDMNIPRVQQALDAVTRRLADCESIKQSISE